MGSSAVARCRNETVGTSELLAVTSLRSEENCLLGNRGFWALPTEGPALFNSMMTPRPCEGCSHHREVLVRFYSAAVD